MPRIGPDAQVRLKGQPDHDLATINWTKTKTKTPFTPLGKKNPDRATVNLEEISWDFEAQSRSDGTWAIDWFGWYENDEMNTIVGDAGGTVERLVDAWIDELQSTPRDDNGAYRITGSGGARLHRYE